MEEKQENDTVARALRDI